MTAKRKAKKAVKKPVRKTPKAKKPKATKRKPRQRQPQQEHGLAALAGEQVDVVAERPWEIVQILANDNAVFGLGSDGRVYKWDTRGAVWKLFKDGL